MSKNHLQFAPTSDAQWYKWILCILSKTSKTRFYQLPAATKARSNMEGRRDKNTRKINIEKSFCVKMFLIFLNFWKLFEILKGPGVPRLGLGWVLEFLGWVPVPSWGRPLREVSESWMRLAEEVTQKAKCSNPNNNPTLQKTMPLTRLVKTTVKLLCFPILLFTGNLS